MAFERETKSVKARFPVVPISLHPGLELDEAFLAQRIEALLSIGAHLHHTCLSKNAQVTRHARLVNVHALADIAYCEFLQLHRFDDAKTDWVSESMEEDYLRVHVYTLS